VNNQTPKTSGPRLEGYREVCIGGTWRALTYADRAWFAQNPGALARKVSNFTIR